MANSESWHGSGGFAGTSPRNEQLQTNTTGTNTNNLTPLYPFHHPFALSSSAGTTASTTIGHGLGHIPLVVHSNNTNNNVELSSAFAPAANPQILTREMQDDARERINSPQARQRNDEQQQQGSPTTTRENNPTTPPLLPLSSANGNSDLLLYCQQNHASIQGTLPMPQTVGSKDRPLSGSLTRTAHCVIKADTSDESEEQLRTLTPQQHTTADAAGGSFVIQVPNGRNDTRATAAEPAATTTKPSHDPPANSTTTTTQSQLLLLACDRPKRPRTAYNFFFQHERQKMLQEQLLNQQQQEETQQQHLNQSVPTSPKKSSGGRIPHGVGFAPMAQAVSRKWHALDTEQRAKFKVLERQDKERYLKERAKYLKYQQAVCQDILHRQELLFLQKQQGRLYNPDRLTE